MVRWPTFSRGGSFKCAHHSASARIRLAGPRMKWRSRYSTGTAGLSCSWHAWKMIEGCPFWAMGFAFTLSFFPGFVRLLAGILAFGPRVAGSLVFGMLSLRDALDFSGGRGNLVLCRTGPSMSESEKGQTARAFSSQRQGSWIHLVLKEVFSSSDWKGP